MVVYTRLPKGIAAEWVQPFIRIDKGSRLPQAESSYHTHNRKVCPPTPIHTGYLPTFNAVPHERFFFHTTAKSH